MKSWFFNRSIHSQGVCASLLFTLALMGNAWAQPDLANTAKAENPTNRAPRANRRGQGNIRRDDPQARLRRQFVQMGLTDAAQQDALITYILAESTARESLVAKGRTLSTKLRAPALTDTQALGLLNTYNAAIDDNKARHDAALAKLKKSIDFAKNPKVETYLTLLGFYGDGPVVMNSFNARQRLMFNFRGVGEATVTTPATTAKAPETAAKPLTTNPAATAAVRG